MTDYELVYLFGEMGMVITSIFSTYASILFAFLAASFLAARQLSLGMSVVVIGIFTTYSAITIFEVNRGMTNLNNLAVRIKEAAQVDGSDLAWHAITSSPGYILGAGGWLFTMMLAASFGGAIYFFFACRRGEFRTIA
jgi:hypothetical protein